MLNFMQPDYATRVFEMSSCVRTSKSSQEPKKQIRRWLRGNFCFHCGQILEYGWIFSWKESFSQVFVTFDTWNPSLCCQFFLSELQKFNWSQTGCLWPVLYFKHFVVIKQGFYFQDIRGVIASGSFLLPHLIYVSTTFKSSLSVLLT